MNEAVDRAAQTFHSTTMQAAALAQNAGVKKLLIGHFSAKYTDLELMVEEARTIFPKTELATEGEKYSVASDIMQPTE
ncbi:MAG: hypothetical protein ACHQD9_07550 [Chitinophagales bacterium]